jgi:hypothetical protein
MKKIDCTIKKDKAEEGKDDKNIYIYIYIYILLLDEKYKVKVIISI